MKHQTSRFTITWVDLTVSICTFLKHHCSINTSYGKKKVTKIFHLEVWSKISSLLRNIEYIIQDISQLLFPNVFWFNTLKVLWLLLQRLYKMPGEGKYIYVYLKSSWNATKREGKNRKSYCRILLSFRNEMSVMSYWIVYRVTVVKKLF